MSKLNDVLNAVKANKEVFEIPYENIPEELGAFKPVPQPGSFRFRIPASIDDCFDTVEIAQFEGEGDQRKPIMRDGKPVTKTYIQLVFDRDKALAIVQSKGGVYDGEDYSTRISNVPRNRFAGKGVKVQVSDLTYLLRALDPTARPVDNEQFVHACLAALPGREFGADIEWSGYCNPKKDAMFPFEGTEPGSIVYETSTPEGASEPQKGCGAKVYQSDWPKVGGLYAERATCPGCNASIRPFGQLARFRA